VPGSLPVRRPPATRRRARAFSLLELIVALALVAVLATIFIVSIPNLMDGLATRPLPEILQKAVRDARYQAALKKEIVSLRFDAEKGAFVVFDRSGATLAERESGYGPESREIAVRFFQIMPLEGVSSFRASGEQVGIELVRFHPDRSSTPFVAELDIGNVRSRHRYDPFSDLEIKDE
jgi:prepilin-type N-terminal cleavage/methylation domain-containing protein